MNAAANAPAQQEDVGDDLETDDDLDAEVDAYIQDALGSTPRPIDWRRVPPNVLRVISDDDVGVVVGDDGLRAEVCPAGR